MVCWANIGTTLIQRLNLWIYSFSYDPHYQLNLDLKHGYQNYPYRLIYEIIFWQQFCHFSRISNKQIANVGPTLYKGVHDLQVLVPWANVGPTLHHISNKTVYFQNVA